MNQRARYKLASNLLSQSLQYGASLAGLASVEDLKKEPSSRVLPLIHDEVYVPMESPYGLKQGEVRWPEDGRSVLVFAVTHPQSQPELDWWYGQINPPGNNILKNIAGQIKTWLQTNHPTVKVYSLPYHVERGGVFLKDAARLAGLGCIGRNNLLVTAQYGSQVRLRAMIVDVDLPPTGPSRFDPCLDCDAPCLKSCPNQVFAKKVLNPESIGEQRLPGRIGNYNRSICAAAMITNENEAQNELVPEISAEPIPIIKYCRNCELSCPLGSYL